MNKFFILFLLILSTLAAAESEYVEVFVGKDQNGEACSIKNVEGNVEVQFFAMKNGKMSKAYDTLYAEKNIDSHSPVKVLSSSVDYRTQTMLNKKRQWHVGFTTEYSSSSLRTRMDGGDISGFFFTYKSTETVDRKLDKGSLGSNVKGFFSPEVVNSLDVKIDCK